MTIRKTVGAALLGLALVAVMPRESAAQSCHPRSRTYVYEYDSRPYGSRYYDSRYYDDVDYRAPYVSGYYSTPRYYYSGPRYYYAPRPVTRYYYDRYHRRHRSGLHVDVRLGF